MSTPQIWCWARRTARSMLHRKHQSLVLVADDASNTTLQNSPSTSQTYALSFDTLSSTFCTSAAFSDIFCKPRKYYSRKGRTGEITKTGASQSHDDLTCSTCLLASRRVCGVFVRDLPELFSSTLENLRSHRWGTRTHAWRDGEVNEYEIVQVLHLRIFYSTNTRHSRR